MAELFLARDPKAPELRVIKRILPYLSQEAEFVQMFLDEARIAAQLHHPNIIQLHELGKLEDSIFIAMEFVDGVDLRKLLQEELKNQSHVPWGIAASIAARVCDGLHYAHNGVGLDGRPLEIIHRDISPQNVMVGFDGRVKLVDFGIARAGAFMERSKPGVIKGKFLYLSPEQLSHDPIDHRADLFAVGTMLYEVTTGKSPFHKMTTEAVILAIRHEEPPPPHLVVPGYPLELSRIVMRCLTKDRSRRYQQAGEIAEDLNLYLEKHAPTAQEDVARYVTRRFGDEVDRTLVNVQGLVTPPRPLPPRPPPPKPPPPVPDPPETSEDEFTRTEMARPLDLKEILGKDAPTPAPRRKTPAPVAFAPSADDVDELSRTLSTSGRDVPFLAEEPPTRGERGPRARPPPSPKKPVGEEESTMEYGTLADNRRPLLTPKRIIVAAVAMAVLLILVAAVVRVFRAPEQEPEAWAEEVAAELPEAEPAPDAPAPAEDSGDEARAVEPASAGEEASAPEAAPPDAGTGAVAIARGEVEVHRGERVPVIFKASAGTRVWSGDRRFRIGRTYRLDPGTHTVSWRCRNGVDGTTRFTLEEGRRRTVPLSLSCRRK